MPMGNSNACHDLEASTSFPFHSSLFLEMLLLVQILITKQVNDYDLESVERYSSKYR